MRGQLGPGVHGDAHADLVHIQLGKLAHDLLFELFRRRAPRLGQLGCNALGLAEHFAVLPAKLLAAVVRILKRVKLCLDPVAVRQDLRYRTAVFLLETVYLVEALFYIFAFRRGKVQIAALCRYAVAQIGREQTHLLGLLRHAVKGIRHLAQRGDRRRHLIEQSTCTADLIVAAHRKPCAFERTRYLPCVVEVSLALCKRLVLVRLQRRLFDLVLVERHHVDALQTLLFAGLERVNFAPERQKRLIIRPVALEQRCITCVAVQIVDVMRLVEQLLTVVLTVNVDQIRRKQPQRRGRHRLHVDAAGAFSVRGELTLDMQRIPFVTGKIQLVDKLAERRRQIGEYRADKALFRARTHQIAADSSAEDRANRVDDDTLARAGLTGEHGQSALQLDVRALDHGNIFNVE